MKNYIAVCFILLAFNSFGQGYSSYSKACDAAGRLEIYKDSLLLNPKEFLSGASDDSCVIVLLETVTFSAIENKEYLPCLDSMFNVSDGYVAEYFLDIGTRLFNDDFNDLSRYIFENRNKHSYVERFLIEGLSMEIGMADNRIEKRPFCYP